MVELGGKGIKRGAMAEFGCGHDRAKGGEQVVRRRAFW